MRVAATTIFSLIKFTILSLLFMTLSAGATTAIVPDCIRDAASKFINCEIRLTTPDEIDRLFLKKHPSDTEIPLNFKSFGAQEKQSAWLLLIDQSNPDRGKILEKIIQQIRSHIIKNRKNQHSIGIAAFSEDMNILAPIGAGTDALHRALDKIQPSGEKANLFQNSIKALQILSENSASRKALVIFSDGKNDVSGTRIADIINKAKITGTLIYGVGFSDQSRKADLQNLWQLANKTGGLFRSADTETQQLADNFSNDFYGQLENGGQVSIPIADDTADLSQIQLIAQLKDGSRSMARISSAQKERSVLEMLSSYAQYIKQISPLFLAVAGLILTSLVLVVFRVRGSKNDTARVINPALQEQQKQYRKTRKLESADPPQKMASINNMPGQAWLEFIDQDAANLPINRPMMNIGRHADNDIRIKNATVHRRHAVLHATPDGRYVITNLSGDEGNGVLVNNQLVEQSELKNGDVLELGEVRAKFRSEPAAGADAQKLKVEKRVNGAA